MCEQTARAFVAAAIAAFALATPASARAQNVTPPDEQRRTVAIVFPAADQTQELRLLDGSRLYGRVVAIETDHILFRTVAGVDVQVPRSEISSLEIAGGRMVKGEFWPVDSNATRLFFGPTARSLRRGQGYAGVYEFGIPTVKVGVTDRFSIGGGTPILVGGQAAWITPKVQLYASDRAAMAAGVMHVLVPGENDVGLAYAVTTFGPSDAAVTAGAGCAYRTGDEGGCSALVLIGGELRLGRRVKFLSENYVWRGASVLSGGLRYLGDRFSAEVGILAIPVKPVKPHQSVTVPVVNFVWTF